MLLTAVLVSIIGVGYLAWQHSTNPSARRSQPITAVAHRAAPPAATELTPGTLDELLALPPEDLAKVDIARMNLLCATGLPGAEGLDTEHALTLLDEWAERVRFETERHLYRVNDPRYADDYRHSEAYLRASFLLQVLQEDLGIRYDMNAIGNFAFDDSRVAFLHGMIPAPGRSVGDTPGGTCVSMPVMYVAVGRRLGYPLKLALTSKHVFARWDGEDHAIPTYRERFNIEGTNHGFISEDDAYYMTWPDKLTDFDVRANGYLASLTPSEEFALFLSSRGHCGKDNEQYAFAARCFENAYRYDPRRSSYSGWFVEAADRGDYKPSTPQLQRILTVRREALALRTQQKSMDPFDGIPMANRPNVGVPAAKVQNAPGLPVTVQPSVPPTGTASVSTAGSSQVPRAPNSQIKE